MLIIPLHRPLTWSTFPALTAVILLINVFIYFGLQSGDHRRQFEVLSYYEESGMASIEAPLYIEHLKQTSGEDLHDPDELPEEFRKQMLTLSAAADEAFRERLERGELFAQAADFQRWEPLNLQFRELDARSFTERFVLRSNAPTADAMLVSMFMHGSTGHLLGNMLFLVIFGFLVEGAIGRWRFLLLYLLSGVGADIGYLATTYGEPGGSLGASGAIAGLMGAVSVLWGLRKIRIFWWIGVLFDYVRVPAIALFPLWLGWELLQLVLYPDSRVAYAAHAGGLVSGALLAWLARQRGWVHEDALSEEAAIEPLDPALVALRQAQSLIGGGRAGEAELLLAPIASRHPERLDLALCRYRAAQAARAPLSVRMTRADAVLMAHDSDTASVREKWSVVRSLEAAGTQLSASGRADLVDALVRIDEGAAAMTLLQGLPRESALQLSTRWLRLAHALTSRQPALAQQALQELVRHYPETPEADKARFLLAQSGAVGKPG